MPLGWPGLESRALPQAKGIMNMIGDTALEAIAGVNRAAVDGANFLTTDQINAILSLSGSDSGKLCARPVAYSHLFR